MTIADAEAFWTQVAAAEKVLGPLSRQERTVILEKFGTDLSNDDLVTLLQGKRVLVVKDKNAEAKEG